MEMDDAALEAVLFPPAPPSNQPRPQPDWPIVHRELGKKGVTLDLLWNEYKARDFPLARRSTKLAGLDKAGATQAELVAQLCDVMLSNPGDVQCTDHLAVEAGQRHHETEHPREFVEIVLSTGDHRLDAVVDYAGARRRSRQQSVVMRPTSA
ncbi:TPA: hypothetical protein QDA93_003383 [Burkholderia vietnamiensis]|nr:hypothetical protein [Burkholderia vietnamiensis]